MIILKFTLMHTKFDIFLHFNNRKKFVTFVTYLVIWVRCVSCEGWELRSWSCVKYKILCSFFQHKISFDLSENELFAMIFMIDEILHSLSTFFYILCDTHKSNKADKRNLLMLKFGMRNEMRKRFHVTIITKRRSQIKLDICT
jgi:hypothetical protein